MTGYVRVWAELFALSWRLYPGRTVAALATRLVSACTVAAIALSLRAVVNGILEHDVRQAVLGALGAALSYAVSASMNYVEFLVAMLVIEPVAVEQQQAAVHLDGADVEADRFAVVQRVRAAEQAQVDVDRIAGAEHAGRARHHAAVHAAVLGVGHRQRRAGQPHGL